jgi:hypothetical protein
MGGMKHKQYERTTMGNIIDAPSIVVVQVLTYITCRKRELVGIGRWW